jgi:TRAP-type C4-dicarboxylate transport system substrate-binding protein
MAMLMNKNKYESLPNDLKAVIDKNSGAVLTEMAARTWDKGNEEARKKLTATGHKTLTIKDADYNAMKKSTASVETDWIKQATAKGLDGIKLAAEVHALGNKYLSK